MLVKKVIKRLNSENGKIVVNNAAELRKALNLDKYHTIIVNGRIVCEDWTVELRENQKLVGIEYYLSSSEVLQHRILSDASCLVFRFKGSGSGVRLAEGCHLCNLGIDISIGEKELAGNFGAVCLGSGKHFFIHNVDILMNTSSCCNSGYYGGLVSQVKDGECVLWGNVLILEKKRGRRTCGVIGGKDAWGRTSFVLGENACLEIATAAEGGHGIVYANIKACQNAVLKINTAAYNTAALYECELNIGDEAKFNAFSNGQVLSYAQIFANGCAKVEMHCTKKAVNVLENATLKFYGQSKLEAVIAGKGAFLQNAKVFMYGCSVFSAEILDKKCNVFGPVAQIRIDDGADIQIKVPAADKLKTKVWDVIKAVDAEDYNCKFKSEDAAGKVKEILLLKRYYQKLKIKF